MDIPRLRALNRQWEKVPPLAVMVGQFLGVIKPEPQGFSDSDIAEMQHLLGAGTFTPGKF